MSNLGKTARDMVVGYLILDVIFSGCVGWFVFFLNEKQKREGLHRHLGLALLVAVVTQFIVALYVMSDKISNIEMRDRAMYGFIAPESKPIIENLQQAGRTSIYIVLFTITIGYIIYTVAKLMRKVDE